MKIKKIQIELEIEKKIFNKHGVARTEIEEGLLNNKPIFYRAKEKRYMALTHKFRYITIIFRYEKGIANIRTAYPSSDWQIKLYKRKGE